MRNNLTIFINRNKALLFVAASLFLISFAADYYFPSYKTIRGGHYKIQEDLSNKQKEFSSILRDTALLRSFATGSYGEAQLQRTIDAKLYLYIYPQDRQLTSPLPLFWNTQLTTPPINIVTGNDTAFFSRFSSGWQYLIVRSTLIQGKPVKVVGLLPVKSEYYVNNNYLHNSFVALPGAEKYIDISTDSTAYPLKDMNGETVCYLKNSDNRKIHFNNVAVIIMRLIAVFMLLALIGKAASYVRAKKGLWRSVLFLFLSLLMLRLISYNLPFPFTVAQFSLFSPSIYGSGHVLPSLGDLMINVALAVWVIIYIRFNLRSHHLIRAHHNNLFYIGILSLILIVATLIAANGIRSLVADSQISFDVINFFTLNFYSCIGFAILCAIAVGYFFLVQCLLLLHNIVIRDRFQQLLIAVACMGIIISAFLTGKTYFHFFFIVTAWLIIYLYLMNYQKLSSFRDKVISSKLIFWIFFFSASITVIIVAENTNKEKESRKHFAENIANKTDPSSERMVNMTVSDFNDDILPDLFSRFYNPQENHTLKDSLVNQNFSGYLNKYDTRIYTFDSTLQPLYNFDSTTFNNLNAIIEVQAKPTAIQGLFYYDISFDKFNYISKKTVKGPGGVLLGYLFIIASPKNYRSDTFYPELFTRTNPASIENSPVYSYAIYVNNRLTGSSGDYPFSTRLLNKQHPFEDFWQVDKGGYNELWYRPSDNKLIVIAKPDNSALQYITLFAYMFLSFLIILSVVTAIAFLIRRRFAFRSLELLSHLSIRNQIHGIIILISLVSFLIIGVTTILFFINRYYVNNREKLSKTISTMETEVKTAMDTLPVQSNRAIYGLMPNKGSLEHAITYIAESNGNDLNIYDLDGNLLVSSFSIPYKKGILSRQMDPVAYYHLNKLKDVQYFQEQKIGELKYLNNYIPIRNDNGAEYAYLNIPYFESQSRLEQEISNFLVTIINLNAFIFLIAGIIAFFITNRITQSFFFISDKMRQVNLGKINEVIRWERKDEIGELVKEYNKMVQKLDASAEVLARNEREGAWREMARQVAHEIKNPLTPMKLNLQYLQMAINNNAPNVKEISVYVSKILVEQIDHLSQIASDFSQFANISQTNLEVFDLNEAISKIVLIYSSNINGEISYKPYMNKVMVLADRTQIHRLYTNLIDNAIQAIPSDKPAFIQIIVSKEEETAVVSVRDNGAGIPSDMQGKIFKPNFTTKSSGTGLGLAMCKGILERIKGRIWFETNEGTGTTFFTEIPLAK